MPTQAEIFFQPLSIDENAEFLAKHLPTGRVWDKKCDPNSNIHKLLEALGSGFKAIQEKIEELSIEFDINQSFLLLPDWEKSVGLPDQCFGSFSELAKRRKEVIDRFRKIPKVSLAEIQTAVNELFPGVNISLYPGAEYYSFSYDFGFEFIGGINEKFVLVVKIDEVEGYGFSYDFGFDFVFSVNTESVACYLRELIPANVILFFSYADNKPVVEIKLLGGDDEELLGGDGEELIGL